MFDRYSEAARRAIFFARYEASAAGCRKIESEHIVLGLAREDAVLRASPLAEAVRPYDPQPPETVRIDLPLSHESKRILVHAAEESEALGHVRILCLHLALGVLREEKSKGAKLLTNCGWTAEKLKSNLPPRGLFEAPPGFWKRHLWLAIVVVGVCLLIWFLNR